MNRIPLTANIDVGTIAIVQRLADARGQSVGDVAGWLLEEAAMIEERFLTAGQAGLDDIDNGRVVLHDVVLRDIDAMIARHRARCRD